MKTAILLLSGGLDSYTAGAIARAEGFRLHALTIRYGQTHVQEIEAARRMARWLALDAPSSAGRPGRIRTPYPVLRSRRRERRIEPAMP